jgi:hypothetical protein
MPAHTHSTSTHPQSPVAAPALNVKTRINVGALTQNHNETLVKASQPTIGLKVKTQIKAGSIIIHD